MAASARKETVSSPTPPSATDRLAAAQAALEETDRKIVELDRRRNEFLLADNNAEAIKTGIEITNLKLEARAHADKLALLREKAAEEEQARRAQEKAILVEKIETKLAQRDKAMDDVAAAIKQLATASEKAINIGCDIIAAWSWPSHDLPPALLTVQSVMTAISHELFKASHHPRRYGGADTDPLAGHSLPGSRSPTLQLAEDPMRVRPMADVVADASAFAKQFLHTGKSSSAGAPDQKDAPHGQMRVADAQPKQAVINGEALQRTDAEQRLSDLRVQMAKLAEDVTPAGEAEYLRVVAEMAKVDAEVRAEQKVGAQQHHG
jgi:hypothetical protein